MPGIAFAEGSAFIAEEGLLSNGEILIFHGDYKDTGTPYNLRSIAWRLLEDVGVGIAAYNTPKNLHCLSPNQQVETFFILEHAKRDARVKALVWTATGVKAFNSGAPLKGDTKVHAPKNVVQEYAAFGMAPSNDLVMSAHTRAFWDFPKPIILAINGLAVGGGANTALANFGDVVIASKRARFMWPFAKIGVTPELGSSMMLPWIIGMSRAKQLMMTGDWLSAEEAQRLNLVSEVCEPDCLLSRAIEIAAKITPHNTDTLRLMKQVMNAPLRGQLDTVLARELDTITEAVKKSGGFSSNSPLKSKL